MRYHGTIMRWDYELGFGFIKEEQTKAEIFAHIGEFETENPPPRDGETVSFEIVSNQRGTEEAKNIEYLNRRRTPAAVAAESDGDAPKNLNRWLAGMAAALIGIPLLGAAGYYGLDYWQTYRASQTNNAIVVDEVAEKMIAERRAWKEAVEATEGNGPRTITLPNSKTGRQHTNFNEKPKQVRTQAFRCDGRQHCSQMKSYEEVKFFLKHCPNVKMDGDKNGVPCEKQFAVEISREQSGRNSGKENGKGLKWFDGGSPNQQGGRK